jgi:hypothetical protein
MAKCTFSSPLILTVVTTFTTCLQPRTLSVTASNHCLRSVDLVSCQEIFFSRGSCKIYNKYYFEQRTFIKSLR